MPVHAETAGPVAKFLSKPLGWPTHLAASLAAALLLWGARLPGGDLNYLFAGFLLWAWILLVWLIRPIVRLIAARRLGQSARLALTGWIHWCVAPLLLAVVSLALMFELPFWFAFNVSRPAMDRVARTMLTEGEVQRQKQWVGVMPISHVRMRSGAVEFELDKEEFLWGQRGFYFSPTGNPVSDSHYYGQESVEDGWYIWHYGGW